MDRIYVITVPVEQVPDEEVLETEPIYAWEVCPQYGFFVDAESAYKHIEKLAAEDKAQNEDETEYRVQAIFANKGK